MCSDLIDFLRQQNREKHFLFTFLSLLLGSRDHFLFFAKLHLGLRLLQEVRRGKLPFLSAELANAINSALADLGILGIVTFGSLAGPNPPSIQC